MDDDTRKIEALWENKREAEAQVYASSSLAFLHIHLMDYYDVLRKLIQMDDSAEEAHNQIDESRFPTFGGKEPGLAYETVTSRGTPWKTRIMRGDETEAIPAMRTLFASWDETHILCRQGQDYWLNPRDELDEEDEAA